MRPRLLVLLLFLGLGSVDTTVALVLGVAPLRAVPAYTNTGNTYGAGAKTKLGSDTASVSVKPISPGDRLAAAGATTLFGSKPAAIAAEPMDPELAFQVSLHGIRSNMLRARFEIHDCCYLYRDRLRFALTPDAEKGKARVHIGAYQLPPGESKVDEFSGPTQVYHSRAEIALPIIGDIGTDSFEIQISYQGCSEKGVIVCYPPQIKKFRVAGTPEGFRVSEVNPSAPNEIPEADGQRVPGLPNR